MKYTNKEAKQYIEKKTGRKMQESVLMYHRKKGHLKGELLDVPALNRYYYMYDEIELDRFCYYLNELAKTNYPNKKHHRNKPLTNVI